MTNEQPDSGGIQALYWNTRLKRERGWGVANRAAGDCEVVVNTGTLGTGNGAVTATAGTAFLGGAATSIAASNVDIATGGADPRKDVVYLDSTGAPTVSQGTAEPIAPAGDALANSERPAPNALADVDGVVLAVVLVPANATTISASNIVDLRARADKEFVALAADEIAGGVTATPITNFEGDGLTVDANGNLDATGSGGASGGYGNVSTVVAADSPYKATDGEVILADASGGALTVELPAKSPGVMCVIKKVDTTTNTVTVTAPGTESIDGTSGDVLISRQNVSREFVVGDGNQDYWIV